MNRGKKIVFSTQAYTYLREKVATGTDLTEGIVESKVFPDGECYHRILTDVDDQDVVVIGGTIDDANTLELYDLAYGLIMNGALSLTLVMPYFGYSTMERAVKPGEIVKAKVRAGMFSSLPRTSLGNRFVLMDLHTEGLPHYFEGAVLPTHLYCKPLVMEIAAEACGDNFVLACTDAGRAKWVESLANDMGVNAAFVFKRRLSGSTTEITSISADVENRKVIIYDDMIRTGGSLVNAAKAYKDAGATEIYAITTHGLFLNNSLSKIEDSDLFQCMYSTDTHPNVNELDGNFLKVRSVNKLIVKQLRKF